MKTATKRELEFITFSEITKSHINNYTIPQYGDKPDDEIESCTPEQCVRAIQKYARRFGAERRGRLEELRDMVKIAHTACVAFYKMNPSTEEVTRIMEGRV